MGRKHPKLGEFENPEVAFKNMEGAFLTNVAWMGV
jgi:hypothetical protein